MGDVLDSVTPITICDIEVQSFWTFYNLGLNAAVNEFPDPPHRGAAWGLPRGLPGGLLFACSSPWGVGVFSSFVPRLESRDLSILKIILTIQVTAIK